MAAKLFTFNISLSVLDHLGRNLYRSFATVLGEAISNSWDADANNVWIYIDKDRGDLIIKDDGDGMTEDDFQNKFLKIGYSKRRKGISKSNNERPYIGRKGIGKLALLSCAKKITVISKKKETEYVGGAIDNRGLDEAITEDLIPEEYPLGDFNLEDFAPYLEGHKKGTIIHFEDVKDGIKNNIAFLRKIIALYFRFSILDPSFNIILNDKKITLDDLDDLAQNTQFLWSINNLDEPYVKEKLISLRKPEKKITIEGDIKGFIASVKTPRNLKITDTNEEVGIDLFVNGRLRERDILNHHIPTDRLAARYLYGQIHFDSLDDEKDRFTSSRESVLEDDEKYNQFLINLRKKIFDILNDWDKWRLELKEEGDPENQRISKKERASIGLFNAVSKDFGIEDNIQNHEKKVKTDGWVDELVDDAKYNLPSYTECFISENLIRKHIQERNVPLSIEAQEEIEKWKLKETQNKSAGNISIDLRRDPIETSYLSMDGLANLVDKSRDINIPGLSRDAKEYKPIRDALMHTALLTDSAKNKLTTVRENIKARVKTLLSTN